MRPGIRLDGRASGDRGLRAEHHLEIFIVNLKLDGPVSRVIGMCQDHAGDRLERHGKATSRGDQVRRGDRTKGVAPVPECVEGGAGS